MYYLYLKYIKNRGNEETSVPSQLKGFQEESREFFKSFHRNLQRETVQFQMFFLTILGTSSSALLSFAILSVYYSKRGFYRTTLTEMMTKPFLKIVGGTAALSFTGSAYYAYRCHSRKQNNEEEF